MLAHTFPSDAAKTRVPVIVNCFPYSAPRRLDGVYPVRLLSTVRFFDIGEINAKLPPPAIRARSTALECDFGQEETNS